MHTRVWKGQSNFTLERFIAQHRNAFVSLQAAAEHVKYQLPNEHSRVGYLLEAIQCNDAGLQAAMASIKTDQGEAGLRNDFEASATHLLPYDPVQKKRSERAKDKSGTVNISDTSSTTADVYAFGSKRGIGKTGVHLRYYHKSAYDKLTKEQKDELREWRSNNPGSGGNGREAKRRKTEAAMDKAMAAAVSAAVHCDT